MVNYWNMSLWDWEWDKDACYYHFHSKLRWNLHLTWNKAINTYLKYINK